jgi:hypothetical protein
VRKNLGFAAGIPWETEFKIAYTIFGKKDAHRYGVSCTFTLDSRKFEYMTPPIATQVQAQTSGKLAKSTEGA